VIPARALIWAWLIGGVLRTSAFYGIEGLVKRARRALAIGRRFGDDALAYFAQRFDPAPTRAALVHLVRQAKRNKAFDSSRFIGLSVDGTGAGRSSEARCPLCRPHFNARHKICGYGHHLSMVAVVGADLTLPFDVEPYGPGDSEHAASIRLLQRAVGHLGRRFADYVVADGAYATAPFIKAANDVGLRVVIRLKSNLAELLASAEKRFRRLPPSKTFWAGKDRIEIWDADDFDPWGGLRWNSVRVFRYRQHKPDGTVVEAYWLTDMSSRSVPSERLYSIAKSRWEIENQGFNDAKNRYGLEHIAHHDANAVLGGWLLTLLAMVVERLFRRFLHRGQHPDLTPIGVLRSLWLSIGKPTAPASG
jgi:hypothetical protein